MRTIQVIEIEEILSTRGEVVANNLEEDYELIERIPRSFYYNKLNTN